MEYLSYSKLAEIKIGGVFNINFQKLVRIFSIIIFITDTNTVKFLKTSFSKPPYLANITTNTTRVTTLT